MTKPHYVYALIDPRDGAMFYIGKGSVADSGRIQRLFCHVRCAKMGNAQQNIKKHRKIMKILGAGFEDVEYRILFQSETVEDSLRIEKALIGKLKKHLTNLSPGGIGGIVWQGEHPNKGRPVSPETRAKMSKAKAGKPGNRRGFKASEKTKALNRIIRAQVKREPRLVILEPAIQKNIFKDFNSGMPKVQIMRKYGVEKWVLKRILTRKDDIG